MLLSMGESFQDYSWIQNFEADFLLKVSLKMMNYVDYNNILIFFCFLLRQSTF